MNTAIPQRRGEITSSWLSEVLGYRVPPPRVRRIDTSRGFSGCRLYSIELAKRLAMIAKIAPHRKTGKSIFAAANAREVTFYRRFARGLPVPRARYAALDEATGASTILLDALPDSRAGSMCAGLDHARAASAVISLAEIHARWWGSHAALGTIKPAQALCGSHFPRMWSGYPARLARILPDVVLPPAVALLAEAIADAPDKACAPMEQGACTLVHGDFQADNLLFGADGSVAAIDWQMMGKGDPLDDLGYFLISSLAPHQRRRSEKTLIEVWRGALAARGISPPASARCVRGYRRSIVRKLATTIFATMHWNNQGLLRARWRAIDLERIAAFVDDLAITPDDLGC